MLFMLRFVFFFKQKTAYEMRISDWSSDVCSSDLGVRPATGIADFGASVITGENSAIYRGTNCWAGEIFSESAAGVAGANSGVAANVAVTALPASPTGAQIQAYADRKSVV